MGSCFDYRVYKGFYFKEKNCPECKNLFTEIIDGRRVCGALLRESGSFGWNKHYCNWSEKAIRSKVTQKKAEREWDRDVNESLHCEGHEYSGGVGMLGKNVNWISKVFPTDEKAIEYIENKHGKHDNPIGARFEKARGSSNRFTKQLCGFVIGGWCAS